MIWNRSVINSALGKTTFSSSPYEAFISIIRNLTLSLAFLEYFKKYLVKDCSLRSGRMSMIYFDSASAQIKLMPLWHDLVDLNSSMDRASGKY